MEKGDARKVAGIDRERPAVILEDSRGRKVRWRPWEIAGRKGGVEAYRSGRIELRAGDRVRFTRNDRDAGLVNGQMARVACIEEDRVRFELEDGGTITLGEGHPSLRFLDHAWATTIHSFQGRTVDTIVAAMESGNRALVNQKALYVAISRARYRAELITDDGRKLADQLERASGERLSALDAAADTAAVTAIFGEALKANDPAKVAQAASRYAREEIEPSAGGGAELERKPDRQVAEWGAELETVKLTEPGTVREADADKATSPAPAAGHDRANEPMEMEIELDMDM
ncbi:MAG: ATP-binding domain-containing protein [Rhodospirillales bacterium]|nr:ATP-binding domain-containing protein [Rhodospirillales bacterium]